MQSTLRSPETAISRESQRKYADTLCRWYRCLVSAVVVSPRSTGALSGTARLFDRSTQLSVAYRPVLLALVLVGFLLRLVLLNAFPLREDEAIYGYWALHLTRTDPLMLTVWPDKPPMFLWLLGGIFSILGASEVSVRVLNVFVSTLTVTVVAAVARALWGARTALLSAFFFVFSPFAISFAPTGFTDPLLILFGMLAIQSTVSRRPFWAGLWLAAAIMTKQQGILYVPLILLLMMHRGQEAPGEEGLSSPYQRIGFLLLGAALVIVPILLWDAARWQVAPSPWDLSVRNYGGFALAPLASWPARVQEWGSLLWYLMGSGAGWLWACVLAIAGVAMQRPSRRPADLDTPSHPQLATPVLVAWTAGFVVFHVVTTTQAWDRYLLPLAPILALLLGAATQPTLAARPPGNRLRLAAVVVTWALVLPPAWRAAQGGLPIGGDHGGYAGLHQVIEWLEAEAPPGSVLYHSVLGWHYRFYFFDEEMPAQNRFDLRWYPNPVYLADNAAKIGHRRRFLVAPEWISLRNWERDLAGRQIVPVARLHAGRFTVYELTGPAQTYCDWCSSQP